MNPIFTIGHSTRTIEEFLGLLEEHQIDTLVDIRRFPGSRRYPHFGTDELPKHLAENAIQYLHEEALGGRRKPRPDSPNNVWRNAQFRAYADHMDEPEFRDALQRLIERAHEHRQVVMCAEAVPWRCHRQLLADALVACGVEVFHIIGPGAAKPHTLNPAAQVLPNHHLIYASANQPELPLS